jgi:hypothetical protein
MTLGRRPAEAIDVDERTASPFAGPWDDIVVAFARLHLDLPGAGGTPLQTTCAPQSE